MDVHSSFLKQELQRLGFEEDSRRKSFNESRITLQEAWDKLVLIRSHICDIGAEIENVRIETIASSLEGSQWRGELDSPASHLSLQTASKVAEVRLMRDKVRLKEALQAKILALEDQISDHKQRMLFLSQALKDSAHQLDFSDGASSLQHQQQQGVFAASTRSLEIRSQLLAVSKELNQMEVQLSEFKGELKRLQQELSQFLQPQKASRAVPAVTNTDLATIAKPSTYDDTILELVSNGRPFTSDLVDELLHNRYALDSSDESKTTALQRPPTECSSDEVTSPQMRIIRMNGESPQLYVQRLERRLSTLEFFEAEAVEEFQKALLAVKRFRDLLRDVEFKRCRLELKLSQADRTEQSRSSEGGGVHSSSGAGGGVHSARKDKTNFSSFDNQYPASRQSYQTPSRENVSRPLSNSGVRFSAPSDGVPEVEEGDKDELRELIRTLRFHHSQQHSPASQNLQSRSPKVVIEEETEILALITLYLKEKQKAHPSSLPPTSQIANHVKVRVLSKLLEQDLGALNHEEDERHLLEEMWNLANTFRSSDNVASGRTALSSRSPAMSLGDLTNNSYVARSQPSTSSPTSLSRLDELRSSIVQDNSLFQSTAAQLNASSQSVERRRSRQKPFTQDITIPDEDDQYPYNTNYNRHGHRLSKRSAASMSQLEDEVDPARCDDHQHAPPDSGGGTTVFYLRCSACGSEAKRVVEEGRDSSNCVEDGDETICPECALPALIVERKESVSKVGTEISLERQKEGEGEGEGGHKKRQSTADRKLRLSTESPYKLNPNLAAGEALDSMVSHFEAVLGKVFDASNVTEDSGRLGVSRDAVRDMASRLNHLANLLEHPSGNVHPFDADQSVSLDTFPSPSKFNEIVSIVQQQQLEIERLKHFQTQSEAALPQSASFHSEPHLLVDGQELPQRVPAPESSNLSADTFAHHPSNALRKSARPLEHIEDAEFAADSLLRDLECPGSETQPPATTHSSRNTHVRVHAESAMDLDALLNDERFQNSNHLRKLVSYLEDRSRFSQHHRDAWSARPPHGHSTEVEVEVMVAKHLPEMKKLSKRCDPYVEVVLLDVLALPGQSVAQHAYLEDLPYMEHSILRHMVEVEYDLITEKSKLRVDVDQQELERSFGRFVRVVEYHRTSTQKLTCYPDWRETFVLKSVHVLQSPMLWVIVRDSSNVGHQLKCKDEIIAQAMWPLSFYRLFDRQSRPVSLPLLAPHPMRFRKGRHALDKRCELKLGVRLQSQTMGQQMTFLRVETETLLTQLIRYILSHASQEDRVVETPLRQRIIRLIRAWKLSVKGLIGERVGGVIEHRAPPALFIEDNNFLPRSVSPYLRDTRADSLQLKRKSKEGATPTSTVSRSGQNRNAGPSPSVHKKARHISPHFRMNNLPPSKGNDSLTKVLPNTEHIDVSLAGAESSLSKSQVDIDLSIFKASGQNLPLPAPRKTSPARSASRSSWK